MSDSDSGEESSSAEEDRGGYDCEFVEQPPAAFQTECPICLHILREPCLISCPCGQKIVASASTKSRKITSHVRCVT